MGRLKKTSPARLPTVDDFKLTKQQRDFHDHYCDGETKGNAMNSAIASGYSDSSANDVSYQWVPAAGATKESIRGQKPIAQAIFWTMYRRREIQDQIEARSREQEINNGVKRIVITREYIESSLREIVERCMSRTEKVVDAWNRDLGFDLGKDVVEEFFGDNFPKTMHSAALVALISIKFREYASKYHVFKPTQAKEALKLLGIEIGMFNRVLKKTPDTNVDAMTPDQLDAEERRLANEYKTITAAQKKGANGGTRKQH